MSLNGHLSRLTVASKLMRPTWEQIGPIYRSLFGLASDEVYICPACYQPGGKLLPYLSTLTGFYRRFISVALAWGSPLPDVIRHPALWSPDFPHRSPFVWNGATICPTKHDWYHITIYVSKQLPPINSLKREVFGISSLLIFRKYSRNFSNRFASWYSGQSLGTANSNGSAYCFKTASS